MAAAAFELTIVFTILPVIPYTMLVAEAHYGAGAMTVVAALFYGVFPLMFGIRMWVYCSRLKVGHAEARMAGGNPG